MESGVQISVTKPQEVILRSVKKINVFLSGTGGGKTHELGVNSMKYCINYPWFRQILCANTYKQLSDSTLFQVFKVWKNQFGMIKGIHYVVDIIPPEHFKVFEAPKSYKNTISFANGLLIFTRSLDNYTAIDGMEVGIAFLDETKDTKEEAVTETILPRLRQKGLRVIDGKIVVANSGGKSHNPLYIFTSPAKVMWLNNFVGIHNMYEEISAKIFSKTEFFHYEDDIKCIVIASTYHNEKNLPSEYIPDMIELFKGNKDLVDRLIYGSPISKMGGEYIVNFNRLKHVKEVDFNPDLPIHIAIDINAIPYLSAVAVQIEFTEKAVYVNVVGEMAMREPYNKMEHLANEIEERFTRHGCGFFYYGDPGGLKRQNLTNEFANEYDVIEQMLAHRISRQSNRIPRAYPPTVASRDMVDAAFAGALGFKIRVHHSCEEFIADLEFCKQDPNGRLIKPKLKDKISGVTCETRGHHIDAFRYFFYETFSENQFFHYSEKY